MYFNNKAALDKFLEERNMRYKTSDFYHNPIIGKEVVRFPFLSPKYKEHSLKYLGEIYFDDFVMDELKYLAEEHSGGFDGKSHTTTSDTMKELLLTGKLNVYSVTMAKRWSMIPYKERESHLCEETLKNK